MSITAYGPPFCSTDPNFKQKDWAAVPGACDSNAFGQAGRFEKPVVHKPIIPELEARKPPYEPHDAGLKRTLRDMLGDGDWDHLRVYADGRSEEGGSKVEWATANQPVFYNKTSTPELCPTMEQLGEVAGGEKLEWKKIDVEQAVRNWWSDSEFLDGTTVREVLSGEKTLHTDSDSDEHDDDEDDDALADLIRHEAPWEKKHQVGGTHYSDMAVQPWDFSRATMSPAEYCGYHVGTVNGYLGRHKLKGGLQDIKKAHHHLSELIRYFEEDEEYPW